MRYRSITSIAICYTAMRLVRGGYRHEYRRRPAAMGFGDWRSAGWAPVRVIGIITPIISRLARLVVEAFFRRLLHD